MAHGRDFDAQCSKCRKKTKWVKCGNCNGKGGGLSTQCKWRCSSGSVCENQRSQFH